jgi:hypothetical protein
LWSRQIERNRLCAGITLRIATTRGSMQLTKWLRVAYTGQVRCALASGLVSPCCMLPIILGRTTHSLASCCGEIGFYSRFLADKVHLSRSSVVESVGQFLPVAVNNASPIQLQLPLSLRWLRSSLPASC